MTTVADGNGSPHHQQRNPLTRGARILSGVLTLLAGTAIFAAVSDGIADPRMLPSIVAVAVFGLTALAGMALARREDDPLAAIGGLAVLVSLASLVTALNWLWTIELDGGESNGNDRLAAVGLIASLALGHVSLLLSGRRKSDGRVVNAVLSAAIGLTVGLGVMLSLEVSHSRSVDDQSFWQMVSVTAILALLATVLVPIARHGQRDR